MENNSTSTPTEFFWDCVQSFNQIAKSRGLLHGDTKVVPELLEVGKSIVHSYLQNEEIHSACMENGKLNVGKFFRLVLQVAIDSGILLGASWHGASSTVLSRAEAIKKQPPSIFSIWEKHFNLLPGEVFEFYNAMYCQLTEHLSPLLSKELPYMQDYILHAHLAGFQLGISIILEKMGYK